MQKIISPGEQGCDSSRFCHGVNAVLLHIFEMIDTECSITCGKNGPLLATELFAMLLPVNHDSWRLEKSVRFAER